MLQNQTAKKVASYVRPAEATRYLRADMVLSDSNSNQSEIMVKLPALADVTTRIYNLYTEATSEGVNAGSIICSGTPILYGDGTNNHGIGILKHDAKPGEKASLVTKGKVWLPLAIAELGTAGTDGTLSFFSVSWDAFGDTLRGKTAYFKADDTAASATLGFVGTTDSANHLAVGILTGEFEIKRQYNSPYVAWVRVDLMPVAGEAVSAATPDYSAAGAASQIPAAILGIHLSGEAALNQNVFVSGGFSNPADVLQPEDLTLTTGGTNYSFNEDFVTNVTFAAGLGVAFSITLAKTLADGTAFSQRADYTADFSASVAPANLATA